MNPKQTSLEEPVKQQILNHLLANQLVQLEACHPKTKARVPSCHTLALPYRIAVSGTKRVRLAGAAMEGADESVIMLACSLDPDTHEVTGRKAEEDRKTRHRGTRSGH